MTAAILLVCLLLLPHLIFKSLRLTELHADLYGLRILEVDSRGHHGVRVSIIVHDVDISFLRVENILDRLIVVLESAIITTCIG